MKRLRCAIYTRKSTDEGLEQDFNSLDAQREACAAYIKSQSTEGWSLLSRTYDDGGYSGGTLDRPALRSLLTDVRAKKIDIIVVHKIDRLTRSLLDFAKLVDVFETAGTSFVSVTQSFNTTSSMGRLTLNMLLSFAQFEREITAERIRDKIAASKAKGMWMGGNPPLGYSPSGRSLEIVEGHADLIRAIFERYLVTGNVRILEFELDRDGVRVPCRAAKSGRTMGGGKFTRGQLYKILSNPIYAGKISHHEKTFAGQHKAIVSDELWQAVHDRLEANRQGYHAASSRSGSALLAGLVWSSDGRRFKSNHARKGKKRYRYYVAEQFEVENAAELAETIRIPNRELDATVTRLMCEALDDPLMLLLDADIEIPPAVLPKLGSRAEALLAAVHHSDNYTVRSLVRRVTISPSAVEVQIDTAALLEGLGISGVSSEETLTLRSAVYLTRMGKAIRLIQRNGRSLSPRKPNLEMAQHLVKARLWWEELKLGDTRVADIARREKVNDSWVSRMVRLNFLAPSIVEAIIAGSQPDHIGPNLLRHPALPLTWTEQRGFLGFES
jgi:DNA invertase Pin-like site-specific DNA recombinase